MTIQRMPPLVVPLGQGPTEQIARLFRDSKALADVRNANCDKAGGLRKARAYARIPMSQTVMREVPEVVFLSVGTTVEHELVVVGRDSVYSVAAPSASIDGSALVRRGPSIAGTFSITTVHGSAMGNG